jgi:Carboxypeptidase regulatory-like domain/TonB dependent receptor
MTRIPRVWLGCVSILFLAVSAFLPNLAHAQQTLGSIDGVVTDTTGAVVPQASVSVRNTATNLMVTSETKGDGSYSMADLPIGTYEVTITKQGFEKVVYPQIIVQGNLTTTVKATLQPGQITTSVTVEATPLLDQTDTANGYTLGTDVIQSTPLGTGSFTQLAILAPGTSADFLSGSGSNEGLGNQGIWANGQRDTSNSFTFNSVNANNLFNGNSTSNIADSRFTLNTGENFGQGGQVQTNTSVFDAIGEGLPTPPTETIQELQVTTSMYDASMGQKSGAHIELTTRSGTNEFHGQAYEYFQNSALDAAPTFVQPNNFFTGAPPLHRNVFGGTFGGPIKKDKLFFFVSYQRQQLSDALNGAFSGVPTLPGLTATNRDVTDLVNLVNYDSGYTSTYGTCTISKCLTPAEVDPVALALVQLKLKNGQFLIPSEGVGVKTAVESTTQAYNSAISGPPSTFDADQANANIDYNFSSSDRLAAKYYFQRDPSTSPFAVSAVLGFPQTLEAGSQVFSLDNTTVVSTNATWEQRFGFIRQIANATTGQAFTPSSIGITLPNGALFPGITINNADAGAALASGGTVALHYGNPLKIGPSTNFANAGVFQNQFEGSSKYNWVLGKHTLSFGGTFDYTQLNVLNRENDVASFEFRTFADFLQGLLGSDQSTGLLLDGETNRHFRSKETGLYAQDDFKVTRNITVTYGLRWDWDGPLYEANGLMTSFYPQDYGYSLATDTFNPVNGTPGIGIVVAGNNKTLGTKGVSDSTLTGRQWGFAPRIGVAWSPLKNFVVRAGFGMFYDRGEYFTELSTSAGLGISGPFSVTTQEPFTVPINANCGVASPTCSTGCTAAAKCLSSTPFGTTLPPPPSSLSDIAGLVPNLREMAGCDQATAPGLQQPGEPYCSVNTYPPPRPFLFGGYDPTNKLPYSEDWSLDLQWQPKNDVVLTLGYVGNRGVHLVLPIPFNQPGIATPTHPINNQIYSYGFLAAGGPAGGCDDYNDASSTCFQLPTEETQTTVGNYAASDGNTALRTPYVGINPNADLWIAEGISSYNALEFSVTKKMSHGLQLNASYTYSHALDEGSGLGAGLFFNGNNPLDPRSSYASSDFDRTHVFIISYLYQFPTIKDAHGLLNAAANGWGITGVTTLESGEPFSVIDFTGVAGGIYYSSDDYITNPILPLAPGVTPSEATSRVTINGAQGGYSIVNTAKNPSQDSVAFVNPNAFSVPYLAPGEDGVPPCQTVNGYDICDNFETGFGSTGRNVFRSPFQTRFDFSVFKNFKLSERFSLKFEADAFNLFNHPSLDAPDTDFELNPCYNPVPCYGTTPAPPNSKGFGVIDNTIGSNRFMQFSLHLLF